MNEIIDIGLESTSGGGLEFLMNSSQTHKRGNSSVDIESLERELNDLSNIKPSSSRPHSPPSGGDWWPESKIGSASADYLGASLGETKTWDGYTKVNDSSFANNQSSTERMTTREQQIKKRNMLRKLEDLQKKGSIEGVQVNQESSFEDVEDEYNSFMNEKLKQESIKLQKQWLFNGINAMEYFNNMLNPFDLDLTGWSEKIAEDCEDDDEVFGELYEKYKGGKLAPEVKLLLRVATTAVFISLTNKMISAAVPGMSDVMRQNPEIMKTFMSATVDSLNKIPEMKSNPMMSFAQEMLHQEPKPNMMHGAPPPPVETKIHKGGPPPAASGGANFQNKTPNPSYSQRPDLKAAATGRIPVGSMGLQESGIEINQSFNKIRPDMSGPSQESLRKNLNLNMNVKNQSQSQNQNQVPKQNPPRMNTTIEMDIDAMNEDSLLSIGSLKSLQSIASSTKSSQKPRRKNKSDKNLTLELDI